VVVTVEVVVCLVASVVVVVTVVVVGMPGRLLRRDAASPTYQIPHLSPVARELP
jgi:hypothetical protein